jgi:hypothetical protein
MAVLKRDGLSAVPVSLGTLDREIKMDFTDFMNEAEEILNRLKPRTPRNTVSTIDSALAGGEFSVAIKEVVFSLTKNQIAVAVAERDALIRLTEYLEERRLAEMVRELLIRNLLVEHHVMLVWR